MNSMPFSSAAILTPYSLRSDCKSLRNAWRSFRSDCWSFRIAATSCCVALSAATRSVRSAARAVCWSSTAFFSAPFVAQPASSIDAMPTITGANFLVRSRI